jgi:hypothetical protein
MFRLALPRALTPSNHTATPERFPGNLTTRSGEDGSIPSHFSGLVGARPQLFPIHCDAPSVVLV